MRYSLLKRFGYPVHRAWSPNYRVLTGTQYMGRRRYKCSQPNTTRGDAGHEDKGGVGGELR